MRCGTSGVKFGHLCLALLILLPPSARVLYWRWHQGATGSGPDSVPGEDLLLELEATRQELQQARMDLSARGLEPMDPRYSSILADVLPLGDPSPRRSVFWAKVRGPANIVRDTVAVWNHALAGRVVRTYPRLRLVRVATLLDPAFRVRFQHEGASGMLCGTGESSGGRPILEIRHLSQSVKLEDGEMVLTEGRGDFFPPGVVIGTVEKVPGTERLVVRAALEVEALDRLELLADSWRSSISQARQAEARQPNDRQGIAPQEVRRP